MTTSEALFDCNEFELWKYEMRPLQGDLTLDFELKIVIGMSCYLFG